MATVFAVRASTGKGSFSASVLSEKPLTIKVEIPAEPVRGSANRMLLSGLENMLGCSVQLLAGQTSRRKTLAAECSIEHIMEKMKETKQR
ncbi:putative ACR, YggU family [uncultured archaeon]|nr:putative ACR, YggU family [uncultured archaeon]